ncbi:MAG: STAS domain-containing protein [Lachnospiraceae bacterium]
MRIETVKEENRIILKVEGRIDTNTSKEFQSELLLAFQKQNEVAADLKDVDYVSSAGLRAMLIAYKTAESKKGSFILRNVQGAVREVLNMSGFSKFIQIED